MARRLERCPKCKHREDICMCDFTPEEIEAARKKIRAIQAQIELEKMTEQV